MTLFICVSDVLSDFSQIFSEDLPHSEKNLWANLAKKRWLEPQPNENTDKLGQYVGALLFSLKVSRSREISLISLINILSLPGLPDYSSRWFYRISNHSFNLRLQGVVTAAVRNRSSRCQCGR